MKIINYFISLLQLLESIDERLKSIENCVEPSGSIGSHQYRPYINSGHWNR